MPIKIGSHFFGYLHVKLASLQRGLAGVPLVRDRRGATAVAFGVAATAVIGVVGLGTEGGAWYLTRRDAQNAADPAAYAGAVRLEFAQADLGLSLSAGQTQAKSTARDTATSNGFTDSQNSTTVSVNTPPASGSYAGNTTAVEVIINRTAPRLISRLFLGSDPVIYARGVAALKVTGKACVLALTKGLTVSGNITGNDCSLSSNQYSTTSINANGTSEQFTDVTLNSSGGCSQCAGTGAPYTTYQAPTTDPNSWLQSQHWTQPTGANCISTSFTSGVAIPAPTTGQGFCSDLTSSATASSLIFSPGTYVFWDSSLKITGGSVSCSACTFIFTGDHANQIGGLDITSNVTGTLSAPTSGTYAGILVYRDVQGGYSNGNGNADITINGGSSLSLSGAIYAPSSSLSLTGNATTTCLIVEAASVNVGGTTNVSNQSCPSSTVPKTQSVLLVE